MKAVIVGAGMGGLTAALALHRIGVPATIYESVRDIKPLGVGINVLPNAMRVFELLGLSNRLCETGVLIKEIQFFNSHGTWFMTEPRGRFAEYSVPQVSIHRGETQLVLLDAVRQSLGPDAIVTGHHLVDFKTLSDGRIEVTLTDRATGQVVTDTADLLIGADGIQSVVRSKLFPDEGPAKWNGLICYRGATESKCFLSGATQVMVGNPASRFFMAYPMSGRLQREGRSWTNWAVVQPAGDRSKGYKKEDWNRRADLNDFLPDYIRWNFGWLDIPSIIAGAPEVYEFPFVDRDPLPQWSFGRVTLMGDAAHPMLPWGSSGATLSFVDAYALADSLSRHHAIEDGLRAYEAMQRPITNRVIEENRRAGPVDFMTIIEERAPNGFKNIEDVMSRDELTALVMRYKPVAAFDRETVNKPIDLRLRPTA